MDSSTANWIETQTPIPKRGVRVPCSHNGPKSFQCASAYVEAITYLVKSQRALVLQDACRTLHHPSVCAFRGRLHALKWASATLHWLATGTRLTDHLHDVKRLADEHLMANRRVSERQPKYTTYLKYAACGTSSQVLYRLRHRASPGDRADSCRSSHALF